MGYSDWFAKLLPTSLRRALFAKYSQTLGEAIDASITGDYTGRGSAPLDWGVTPRAKYSVKARFPDSPVGATATPADALQQIGGERQLDQAPGESNSAYATRLRLAWDAWVYGGTALGLLRALYIAGYQNVVIGIQLGRWYSLDGSQNLVTTNVAAPLNAIEGDPARKYWSQFVVLFLQPLPASWVSGGVPAAGSDEAKHITALVARWKPGFARCWRIAISEAGGCWGYPVTQFWNDGSSWTDSEGFGSAPFGSATFGGVNTSAADVLELDWLPTEGI